MKLTYYIDALNGITTRAYEGIVEKENLIKSLELFWANPDYNLKQNHIIDFSRTELQLSSSDILAIVDIVVTNDSHHDRTVAFLVAKPQEAAVTAMYKEFSQRKHITEVFVSERMALEFIEAPSDFYKMLKRKNATVIEL